MEVEAKSRQDVIDVAKSSFITLRESTKRNSENAFNTKEIEEEIRHLTQATQLFVDSVKTDNIDERTISEFEKNPKLFLSAVGSFLAIQQETNKAASLGDDFNLYITDMAGYQEIYFKDDDDISNVDSSETDILKVTANIQENSNGSYSPTFNALFAQSEFIGFDTKGRLDSNSLEHVEFSEVSNNQSDIKDAIVRGYMNLKLQNTIGLK